MPKRDELHQPVRRALEKDGWTVTHDPLYLFFEGATLLADLGAERYFAAEKGNRRIAVEVKGFDSLSPISELEKTIGQLQFYRWALEAQSPDRVLFLAVSEEAYYEHFQKPLFRAAIERLAIKLLVVDSRQEVIAQWIE